MPACAAGRGRFTTAESTCRAIIRWPGHLPAGRVVDQIAAHIDLVPTLLDACGLAPPPDLKLDGKSLLPLLARHPDRWLARPDALLPVAPRRPARARPRLRRPVPDLQAACGANPCPAPRHAAARALRHGARPARAPRRGRPAPRHRGQDVRELPSLVQGRLLHPRLRAGPDRAGRDKREPDDPDPPRLARTPRWLGAQ